MTLFGSRTELTTVCSRADLSRGRNRALVKCMPNINQKQVEEMR